MHTTLSDTDKIFDQPEDKQVTSKRGGVNLNTDHSTTDIHVQIRHRNESSMENMNAELQKL